MPRKSLEERERIDLRIRLATVKSRHLKVEALLAHQDRWGCLDRELLEAYGHSEHMHGFDAGVADAMGD